MIRIQSPSRLHFGLFYLPSAAGEPRRWPNQENEECLPVRHFGGVGLMVDQPGMVLRAEKAAQWSAEGPFAERILELARGFRVPARIVVEKAPPHHVGLGTGTQLALSLARALTHLQGDRIDSGPELARLVERGRRSALGLHGFFRGGFLVEGGKTTPERPGPLVAHHPFPEDWRVLLLIPSKARGLSGPEELRAFQDLPATPLAQTDSLCRLVLLGLLPALLEHDLLAFGEALRDFNRRVGEMFRPVQGGIYAHPGAEEMVEYLRKTGVPGVGQSSWGPTLFAVLEADRAEDLRRQVMRRFTLAETQVFLTRASTGHAVF